MPRAYRLLRYDPSTILFLCVILFSLASHAEAQVVETPEGSVEFIGLEQWTVESLLDSLFLRSQRIAPSQYPSVLRELGFPRAVVDRIRPSGPPGGPSRSPAWISLVTLVEPHRSDVVSLRGGFRSDDPLPASWLEADSLFRQHNPDFLAAVGLRLLRNGDGQPPPALTENLGPSRQSIVERAWTALEDLRSAGNLSEALTILQRDRAAGHRALAAAVLAGFPEEPEAWRGLVLALRDPSARVTAFANQALGPMAVARPRTIDWAPEVESLRPLIAGANLSAFSTVLQTLVSTRISPTLGRELLSNNEHLILGHLASENSPHRDVTHRFLVQISGDDLGLDAEAWRSWISRL